MDNWDQLRDAKAHYYGENFPNGEISDFAYNRAIQGLGGFVIFEFWDFPKWIGQNQEAYAKAMVNYCEAAKAKTGTAPFAVGIQNELFMEPRFVERFVTALRKGLDEKGFKEVKIHMANAPTFAHGLKRLSPYRDNPAVWAKIDFSACNNYDFQDSFSDIDKIDGLLGKVGLRHAPIFEAWLRNRCRPKHSRSNANCSERLRGIPRNDSREIWLACHAQACLNRLMNNGLSAADVAVLAADGGANFDF